MPRLLRLERHPLGPRVHVLGLRVHECVAGIAAIAGGAALALAHGAHHHGHVAGVLAIGGGWMLAKDWHDLFPSRRNTCAWRVGIHRRPGA